MHLSQLGRWMCVGAIAAATAVAVASCGNGTDSSVFGHGVGDASTDQSMLGDAPVFLRDSGNEGGGCMPMTCGDLGFNCGMQGDGCGNELNCGTCSAPDFCGGGGPSKCGTGDGGTGTCTPGTCGGLGYTCGYAGDGCGLELNCGGPTACTSPQYCGGGGFNKCGGNDGLGPDGGPPCKALTSCGKNGKGDTEDCGYEGDGCGGVLDCGTCSLPEYCGGGGFNVCGGAIVGDGGNTCAPVTCATHDPPVTGPNACGQLGDGCGGLITGGCGTCTLPDTCGGGGVPFVCGKECINLCKKIVTCDGGTTTTITGTVLAGTIPTFGTPDPVPGVFVYVPNGPVQAFTDGVNGGRCTQCSTEVTGDPLVSATTAFDGTFTLSNVPAGSNIPLVIQLGRWRRQVVIPSVTACTSQGVTTTGDDTPGTIHMPRTQSEGDIPLTAISTGNVDAIECVLLKMGVDASEFTVPTATGGTGRMQIYQGNGAQIAGGVSTEADLMGGAGGAPAGVFANYDQILLPCWGGEYIKLSNQLTNLVTYADEGGHFFGSHFSYTWLFENAPFNATAQFAVNSGEYANGTAQVCPSSGASTCNNSDLNPKGSVFMQWLALVDPAFKSTMPAFTFENPRHDVNFVNAPANDWMSGMDTNKTPATQMEYDYTFDTPFVAGSDAGSAAVCGHAIFSDFHVANYPSTGSSPFGTGTGGYCQVNEQTHAACSVGAPCPLTPQEKVLEYMLWDLGQCVGPPANNCTPLTCAQVGPDGGLATCGLQGDGCGGTLNCGSCAPPMSCGGGGSPGVCGQSDSGANCTPLSCNDQGINCGPAGDGCGNEIMCGGCSAPQTCGGGGTHGLCGYPEAGVCVPQTCAQQMIFCGPAGDGCGNLIQSCGTCKTGSCGGGGTSGQCGAPDAGSCAPTSCDTKGFACGTTSDGCGNTLNCGVCISGATCENNVCVGGAQ